MAKHIKQRQPGTGKHPLMRYDSSNVTLTMGAASIGTKSVQILFDNSGIAGGKYLKIGKMTIQWFSNLNSNRSSRKFSRDT